MGTFRLGPSTIKMKESITVCLTLVQSLFPSHAVEKALGTRLIVCCLEVLPLRPFTFFCLLWNPFPDFGSIGRSVEKEKTPPPPPKKKKKRRSLELGAATWYLGIITCGAWKWQDVVKIKREQWKKMTKHWLYYRVNWQCFQIMCNYLLHNLCLENSKNLGRSNEAKRSKMRNSLRGQKIMPRPQMRTSDKQVTGQN